jgi:hypothetical protein
MITTRVITRIMVVTQSRRDMTTSDIYPARWPVYYKVYAAAPCQQVPGSEL